jgi:hypothetical protein
MDVLSALLVIVVGLIGLDLAALGWGVDSRDQVEDDHVR